MIIENVEGSWYRIHPHHEINFRPDDVPAEILQGGESFSFDAKDVISISVDGLLIEQKADSGAAARLGGYVVRVRLARDTIVGSTRLDDAVAVFPVETERYHRTYRDRAWRAAAGDDSDEMALAQIAATAAAFEIEEIVIRHRRELQPA